MSIQNKAFYSFIILCVIYSCKSYKEFVVENNCGIKIIKSAKQRPCKVNYKTEVFILLFYSGFNESKVKVVIGDSIYMNRKLTTKQTTSDAGSLILKKQTESNIKIYIDDDCFDFNLDKNYTYYEIHNSEKRFYLNMMHFPSIH